MIQTGLIQYFYLSAQPDSQFETHNISVDQSVREDRTMQMAEMHSSSLGGVGREQGDKSFYKETENVKGL
jgi:hypothetical protein